jgi:hypothetical protein
MTNTERIPVRIKADCTQLGLCVEASMDNGQTWQTVQLTPYKERHSASVMQYKTCINPALDRQEYFDILRARRIDFVEVR